MAIPAKYKLTLPVNGAGQLSGTAAEVLQPTLADYTGTYVSQDGANYTLTCPDGGATTENATYARCELRDLTEWSFHHARQLDTLKVSVDTLTSGHKVILMQIHDGEEAVCKIIYTGGTGLLRALTRSKDGGIELETKLATGLDLGVPITISLVVRPLSLGILVNNLPLRRIRMRRNMKGGLMYFKRGNYYQNNAKVGNTCVVTHYG